MSSLSTLRSHLGHDLPAAGTYAIDAAHTSVEFIARHLVITKVRGRFPDVTGTITIEDETSRAHVAVEVGVASIDTGNSDRDDHLRSADFFDVTEHPKMWFTSTGVEAVGSGRWLLDGDLTLRGVTRPITLEVDFEGAGASPAGDQRIAFSARAEVEREDWGLTWNVALETGGVLVSKRITIEINVQAIAVG